jgi:hypothetical protein
MQSLKPDLTSLRVLTENQPDPDAVYDPTEGADWVQRGLIVRKPDGTLVGVYHPFKESDTTIVIPDLNTGDKIWAHWENPSVWHDVYDNYTFPNSDYSRTEGELTNTSYPHLKAGLYRFTMEVALRNYPNRYDAIEKFNITVKYGSHTLRAQSFMFDRTIYGDTGIAETVWFGGVFRMPAEGDVSVHVENVTTGSHPAGMKCSHIFVNKLGD